MKTTAPQNTKTLTLDEQTPCGDLPPAPADENGDENESRFHSRPVNPLSPKSTIPAKVPPETLAAIHDALISSERAPYMTIYENFALREKGIGFTAFYNYARPIRLLEACQTQAGLSRTLAPDALTMLPELIATRLLAALVDDAVPPRQIQYLVDAYRMASNLHLAHRRLDAQVTEIRRKAKLRELDDLTRTFKEYKNATRAERKQPNPKPADVENE